MTKTKIAISIDQEYIDELDRLIDANIFQSRSQAIQQAIYEKLSRIRRTRLSEECAKLDPVFEKEMAEEGISEDIAQWPEY